MTTLVLCPACDRHVRPGACPFCGVDASEVLPLPARPVGRRELTRAAIMVGAAVLAGCGPEITYGDEGRDGTTGGEGDVETQRDTTVTAGDDVEPERDATVTTSADDGLEAQADTTVTPDEPEEREQTEPETLSEEERERQRQLLEEERQRREALEPQRRRRELPACVRRGTCPAPPYGTPPARDDLLV